MLNRAPFADRVAGVLKGLPKGTSLIVGIHGPWGDGKTTVLNLVRANLAQEPRVLTVEFNPWRFADEATMLAGFFSILAGAIRTSLRTRGEEIAAVFQSLGRYASVVTEVGAKAAALAERKANVGLEDLRFRLISALAASDMRIVVLIDDIDRLDKNEIRTLFRLIKACADFPNICYVLAFDDVVVTKSLAEQYGAGDEQSGRAFLEKIIQVPLKLPPAATEDLRSLCFSLIDVALSAAGIELAREQIGEFISAFDRILGPFLKTPRAAKRYANGLMFALPALFREAHPVDVLLIEALRAFCPAAYDVIRDNQSSFSGVENDRGLPRDSELACATLLNSVLEAMPTAQSAAIQHLAVHLFPRLGPAYAQGRYGSDWLDRWSREQRISSPEYCGRYFSYAVLLNDVSDSEIGSLLTEAASGDRGIVASRLRTLLTPRKARRVVGRLRAAEDTVNERTAELLAECIAPLAGNIPNAQDPFSFAEPMGQAAILISNLLARITDRRRRVEVATRIVASAEPLWFAGQCVRWMHVTDAPEKSDLNVLTSDELLGVRRFLVDRIKANAATGSTLFDPDIPQELSLLFQWASVEGRDPVQAHLISVFASNPNRVVMFLAASAPRGWSGPAALPHVSELGADNVNAIAALIDPDELAKFIRAHFGGGLLSPKWIPGDERPLEIRLPEQFLAVYEELRAAGASSPQGGELRHSGDTERDAPT